MAEAHHVRARLSRRDSSRPSGPPPGRDVAADPADWARADGPASRRADPQGPAETAVNRFYDSLKDEQRKIICFPFDHPKRSQVQNNWHIVKPTIKDLTKEQQALCDEIFKGLCSDDGYERFQKQMEDDAGGFENYSVAVFGNPGSGKPFEWVMTGRHNTLRADGDSVENAAFGGPIFYGHDATGTGNDDTKHTDNVWWYQGEQANAIFATLDDKQQARALFAKGEDDVRTSASRATPPTPRTARRRARRAAEAAIHRFLPSTWFISRIAHEPDQPDGAGRASASKWLPSGHESFKDGVGQIGLGVDEPPELLRLHAQHPAGSAHPGAPLRPLARQQIQLPHEPTGPWAAITTSSSPSRTISTSPSITTKKLGGSPPAR